MVAAADFEGQPVNLGAEAKIKALTGIFSKLGLEVHFVDSSHWVPRWAASVCGRHSNVGDLNVTLWRPFTVPNRKLGKVLNVLAIDSFFRKVQTVQPALVWIYNSYAFEAALAQRFSRMGVPIVLELEDLPLSRPRGWNPKPYWDQLHFSSLLAKAALVTFVNEGLMTRYRTQTQRAMLLPSVLDDDLVKVARRCRFSLPRFRVGYFGGLSHDKGAAVMLEALATLPAPWEMVATGAGELASAFVAAARADPGRFTFHGTVSQPELHRLMATCDVIVNPHSSIEAMRDGVFPFKVCESLACGALLLSTALPSIDETLDDAVMFFDGTAVGLNAALERAHQFNSDHSVEIDQLRLRIAGRYSASAVASRLGPLLSELIGVKLGGAPGGASPGLSEGGAAQ